MSLFDQNHWYQITIPTFDRLSMTGLQPVANTPAAAVFFQTTNTSSPAQRWQIYPIENSSYIIRSQSSLGSAYLGVRANTTSESQNGGTTAIIRNASLASYESFWQTETFDNGLFPLKTVANGTKWNLFVKDAGLMAMTNDIAGQQKNQGFNFTRLGKINDAAFSTVQTMTPSATPSSSTGGSGNSTGNDESSGLSTVASVGIGVGVGLAGLIALILGVFLLLRRNRRRREAVQHEVKSPEDGLDQKLSQYAYRHHDAVYDHGQTEYPPGPQELDTAHGVVEAEGGPLQINEMQGKEPSPVELPAGR